MQAGCSCSHKHSAVYTEALLELTELAKLVEMPCLRCKEQNTEALATDSPRLLLRPRYLSNQPSEQKVPGPWCLLHLCIAAVLLLMLLCLFQVCCSCDSISCTSSTKCLSRDAAVHAAVFGGDVGGNGDGLHGSGGVCKAGPMLRSPLCKHSIRFAHPEKLVKSQGSIGSHISD